MSKATQILDYACEVFRSKVRMGDSPSFDKCMLEAVEVFDDRKPLPAKGENMKQEILKTLLDELKAEHTTIAGGCRTCIQSPVHPCATRSIIARIEALLKEASTI